jgi:preprotein translocase subunit SecE
MSEDQNERPTEVAPVRGAPRRERTRPRQFLREVRGELRRVAWPSRKEVASYSVVVLVTVTLMMAYIAGLDTVFGRFVFWIFG